MVSIALENMIPAMYKDTLINPLTASLFRAAPKRGFLFALFH